MLNTSRITLAGIVVICLWATGSNAQFVPNDILVSDPTSDLPDPEFDLVDNHFVWQDTDGNLWLARLDPTAGDLLPANGKGLLLDTNLRGVGRTGNGPEWAYGDGRPYIAYTRDLQNTYLLGAGFLQRDFTWDTSLLSQSFRRSRPEGTASSHLGPPRIAYNYSPEGGDIAVGWRDLMDASSEGLVTSPILEPQGGRWVESEDRIVVLIRDSRYEFGTVDITAMDPQIVQATFTEGNKINAYFWWAPEYGEPLFSAMLLRRNRHLVGIFRRSAEDPDTWVLFNSLEIPSPDYPFISSPEAFVSNGKSYIVTVAASELGGDNFLFQPKGPSEIWIAGIDPDEPPFFRRVDDPSIPFPDQPQRSEPEMYTTANGPVVFYTELAEDGNGVKTRLLRRAETGLGPDWDYDQPSYSGAWSTVNRDNRNSGSTPFPLADDYEEASFEAIANRQSVRMVMGPEGNLYFSMLRVTPEGPAPEFRGIDTRNGNQEVFTLSNADISSGFVGTNALVDASGNFYIAGESELTKFTAAGELIWKVAVPGLPRALQFGPDGRVMLFTWNGWFQTVDPDTAEFNRQNLTPNRVYGESSAPCFAGGGDISRCAYIDAPAVDAEKNIIFTTYTTDNGNSRIEAWSYAQGTRTITLLWATGLMQGNVTSPVLSANYERIYIETQSGELRALDATDGSTIWVAQLGYATSTPKEPVVNDFGYIMPGGDTTATEVTILRDLGDTFEWSYSGRRFTPLSQAAAGRGNRFVLAASRRTNGATVLLVVNPFHGIISETPWEIGPNPASFTGVTIREDGWVFLGGGESTTFKAYRPLWPQY